MIVPGIAGMAVMSTTFSALAYQHRRSCASRACSSGSAARRCRRALPRRDRANAVTNTALQIGLIIAGGQLVLRDRLAAGLARAGRLHASAWSASRRWASRWRTRSRTSTSAPAYVNAVFLPVIFISGLFFDADNAPQFLRDIAEALPLKHLIDGLSGAMVTGEPIAATGAPWACSRCGRRSGSCWRSAASAGKRAGPNPQPPSTGSDPSCFAQRRLGLARGLLARRCRRLGGLDGQVGQAALEPLAAATRSRGRGAAARPGAAGCGPRARRANTAIARLRPNSLITRRRRARRTGRRRP